MHSFPAMRASEPPGGPRIGQRPSRVDPRALSAPRLDGAIQTGLELTESVEPPASPDHAAGLISASSAIAMAGQTPIDAPRLLVGDSFAARGGFIIRNVFSR